MSFQVTQFDRPVVKDEGEYEDDEEDEVDVISGDTVGPACSEDD